MFKFWKYKSCKQSSQWCRRKSAISSFVTTQITAYLRWEDGYYRTYALFDGRIYEHMKSKVFVFSDSVLCVGGNGGNILMRQALVEKFASHISQVRSIVNSTISQESLTNSCGEYTWDEQLFNFSSYIQEMLAEEGVTPSQLKARMYNDVNWWQNQKRRLTQTECDTGVVVCQIFRPRTLVTSRTTNENGTTA